MRLVWSGHLDASCSSRLLGDFAGIHGCARVELELSGVTYMDSSAFAILVQLILGVWSWNGRVELVNPSGPVREKLRASKLEAAL